MKTMVNRRNFLKNASLLTVGGILTSQTGCNSANRSEVAKQPTSKTIGLQIYSLGRELFEDVHGGLKKIKEMGYSTIELAGYNDGKIGNIEMTEFKKMSDDAGLTITSTHVNPPVREYTPDNRQQIADFWKKASDDHAKIGVTYLIQPGQPSTRNIEEVSFVAEIFNEAGQIAKKSGLQFGYHNHEMEFARVIAGGEQMIFGRHGFKREQNPEIIYDLLLNNTDPSLVLFELDVYWTVMGQQDPVAYMKKYPTRIQLLHIKDKDVLGQSGMMNFEMIFKQAYTNNMKGYFVELEGIQSGTQFEGVKECADYLLNADFVK